MLYISNAFSLSMLGEGARHRIAIYRIDDPAEVVAERGQIRSVVGHESTAALFSAILDRDIQARRESITLTGEDTLLVGQYSGPRLPEGATELPDGAAITWWLVVTEPAS